MHLIFVCHVQCTFMSHECRNEIIFFDFLFLFRTDFRWIFIDISFKFVFGTQWPDHNSRVRISLLSENVASRLLSNPQFKKTLNKAAKWHFQRQKQRKTKLEKPNSLKVFSEISNGNGVIRFWNTFRIDVSCYLSFVWRQNKWAVYSNQKPNRSIFWLFWTDKIIKRRRMKSFQWNMLFVIYLFHVWGFEIIWISHSILQLCRYQNTQMKIIDM